MDTAWMSLMLCEEKPSDLLEGLAVGHPELEALKTCQQNPKFHPEGSVWVHTLMVVDKAAEIARRERLATDKRLSLLLAALCHDISKPLTTAGEFPDLRSPGHAEMGPEVAEPFLNRIGVADWLKDRVNPLISFHMTYLNSHTKKSVRRLKKNLQPASFDELLYLIEADILGRESSDYTVFSAKTVQLRELADVEYTEVAKQPKGIVTGDDLIKVGWTPGPRFGMILSEARKAEEAGEFNNVESGLEWVKFHFHL